MSDSWFVNVQGRAYGPYSEAQMQDFAVEGRLAPHSLVTRAGETEFRAASDEPGLALIFPQSRPAEAVAPDAPAAAQAFGRQDDGDAPERSHVVIIADMKSRSVQGLEEEIHNLGSAYPLFPQVWLLATEQPVNAIRNLLVQKLGKMDVLFVVDATHNKADTRIRRIWTKPVDAARISAAG